MACVRSTAACGDHSPAELSAVGVVDPSAFRRRSDAEVIGVRLGNVAVLVTLVPQVQTRLAAKISRTARPTRKISFADLSV